MRSDGEHKTYYVGQAYENNYYYDVQFCTGCWDI